MVRFGVALTVVEGRFHKKECSDAIFRYIRPGRSEFRVSGYHIRYLKMMVGMDESTPIDIVGGR
jgi:hypothetical protein